MASDGPLGVRSLRQIVTTAYNSAMGRLIRSARDAEQAALDWMTEHGFPDATLTSAGIDEGIDVDSSGAIAQVKAQVKPVGRPLVQQLKGVAAVDDKQALFFALGGYTDEAIEWARRADVALFDFDLQGAPNTVNKLAQELATQWSGDSGDTPESLVDASITGGKKQDPWDRTSEFVFEDGPWEPILRELLSHLEPGWQAYSMHRPDPDGFRYLREGLFSATVIKLYKGPFGRTTTPTLDSDMMLMPSSPALPDVIALGGPSESAGRTIRLSPPPNSSPILWLSRALDATGLRPSTLEFVMAPIPRARW